MKEGISFRNKIKYKIWKHLNKKLLKKGIISDEIIRTALGIGNRIGTAGSISIPYEKPKSTCRYVVSNIGCGSSGSGTIIDFLREFDSCTVHGFFSPNRIGDKEKVERLKNSKSQIEMDFSTLTGNLFELERLITSNNFIMKDAAVKRFIALCEWNYSHHGGIYNDEYMRLSREFVDKITEFNIKGEYQLANFHMMVRVDSFWEDARNVYSNLENPFMVSDGKEYRLYILKNMSIAEYRKLASEYLEKFFQTIESEEYLVLDHFFSNLDSNFDVKSEYVENLKSILVWRDPRDVYATSVLNNLGFYIPTDPERFIKWYRLLTVNQLEGENVNFKNCLVIRFEDFVLKYDEVSKQIMDFLGLKEENHVDPKGYFKPEISGRTIGIYKNLEDQSAVKRIEKELSKYIYNN